MENANSSFYGAADRLEYLACTRDMETGAVHFSTMVSVTELIDRSIISLVVPDGKLEILHSKEFPEQCDGLSDFFRLFESNFKQEMPENTHKGAGRE